MVRWFATAGNTGRTIYTAPVQVVLLAQDNLRRNIVALGRTEPCERIATKAREGWVVVIKLTTEALLGPSTTDACVARWQPVFKDSMYVVYDVHSLQTRPVAMRTAPVGTQKG